MKISLYTPHISRTGVSPSGVVQCHSQDISFWKGLTPFAVSIIKILPTGQQSMLSNGGTYDLYK